MASIDAKLVNELRLKTGSGMMNCKKALVECSGDLNKAAEWLKKKGLASANKKADREVNQGVIAVHLNNDKAVIIELNSETDFVSKNEKFLALANSLAKAAIDFSGDLNQFLDSTYPNKSNTINQEIIDHIAVIGENISLKRTKKMSVSNGVISHYLHNKAAEGIGGIGVLIAIESNAPKDRLQELGKKIAMHIAAIKTESITIKELDPKIIEKERATLKEQAKESGKPQQVIDKMVEGRMKKFYEQIVLLDQPFVMDNKSKVSQVIEEEEKIHGEPIKIKSFIRFAVGE